MRFVEAKRSFSKNVSLICFQFFFEKQNIVSGMFFGQNLRFAEAKRKERAKISGNWFLRIINIKEANATDTLLDGCFFSDSGLERSCEAATGLPRGGPRASVDELLVEGCPNQPESLSLMMAISLTGAQDKRNRVGNSFFAVYCIARRKAIEL